MTYDPKETEKKWQDFWEKEKIYRFDFSSDKDVFSIDNPPRYASGALHLGHATHYTHIDFIARYKRMRGYNVFFPLCYDVNGMPIEVNVEKLHKIRMRDLPRQEFVKLCEDFANSKIDIMTQQFKILGESMDPSIYYQTDAPYYRKITQLTFLDTVQKGLVYRGLHPVNWCPRCGTAIAESEVVYDTRKTNLYYIIFNLEDGGKVTIATTRPELIPACLFLSYNKNDQRYKNLEGKYAILPIFNRKIPIFGDEDVDPTFGTGIEMVCSIGDKNDLKLIKKHGMEIIRSVDENGRLTEIGGKYKGMFVEEARKNIVEDLKKDGRITKIDDLEHSVGTCWRCGTPLEIINKEQWFIKTVDLKNEILESANKLKWIPDFMKKRLDEWVNSIEWDWVVSRQRYFATPIPVWICKNGHSVFPKKEDLLKKDGYIDPLVDKPPYEKCPICGSELTGSDEVFDTWVDSSISPLYNAFLYRDDEKFKKLYPMSLRPQAHDIIRTWAFYSIVRCKIVTGIEPWKDIFIDGHILAEDGRPMHASWGNVVDPLKIIDEYGTDAFRYFAATCTIGEDTPFRRREVVHGKRLITKLYNLGKFVEMHVNGKYDLTYEDLINRWLLIRYSEMVKSVTSLMDDYRYDRAIREIEDFFWHTFADEYIEIIKYRIKDHNETKAVVYHVYLGLLKLFAPILPHITEEMYHRIFSKYEKKISIHLESWPEPVLEGDAMEGERVKELIIKGRSFKIENSIRQIESAKIITEKTELFKKMMDVISGSLNIKKIEITEKMDMKEKTVVIPDLSKLGPILRDKLKEFLDLIEKVDPQELEKGIDFNGIKITKDYFKIKREKVFDKKGKVIDTGYDKMLIYL